MKRVVQVIFSAAMAASLGIAVSACDSSSVEGESIGYIDGVERMNKSELISAIAKEAGLTSKSTASSDEADSEESNDSTDTVTSGKGDSVRLVGFGTWSVKERGKNSASAAPEEGDDSDGEGDEVGMNKSELISAIAKEAGLTSTGGDDGNGDADDTEDASEVTGIGGGIVGRLVDNDGGR